MNKIIALNSGSSFHINSLTKGIFSKELYKTPYLKELCKNDVKDADILWVSCTSPVDLLIEKKRIFYRVFDRRKAGQPSPVVRPHIHYNIILLLLLKEIRNLQRSASHRALDIYRLSETRNRSRSRLGSRNTSHRCLGCKRL